MAAIQKIVALYERLSRDDEQQGESNSIINQKKYLEDFARSKGFRSFQHFTDDGYSGTTFNRPGFLKMLEEIEAGHVSTVIVKDMSRFGRDYLQVGFYTEIQFPDKGVRFIAINNNVDSDNPTDNEFTPFLNLMNDWYAKDTSKKIRAIFRSRMEDGKRCSGSIPYGYMRRPDDKQTLYIDEEAAAVVRRIFQMTIEGKNLPAIAEILRNDKVLIPSAYAEKHHPEDARTHRYHDPYLWTNVTIGYILDHEEYLGHTVLCKTIRPNFKSKKRRKTRPEERLFFPNTHEAIIDQDTWDMAQRLRKRAPKRKADHPTHRLSGMLFCAECGARMAYHWSGLKTNGEAKGYDSFQCGKYRNFYGDRCTMHFISADQVEKAIHQSIRMIAQEVVEHKPEFLDRLRSEKDRQKAQQHTEHQDKIIAGQKRIKELDNLIRGVFEGQTNGILPARQAQKLLAQYDAEQAEIEEQLTKLKEELEASEEQKLEADRFVKLVRKYTDFTEITDKMLYEFINRVEVHESNGKRGLDRMQQIDIYFNFIGNYVPSVCSVSITPEEHAKKVQQHRERKRAEKAERNHQRHIQKKESLAELHRRAETDPEAAAEYEALLAKRREENKQYRDSVKQRMQADPEFAEYQRAKTRKYAANYQSKLAARAEADPELAHLLEEKKAVRQEQAKIAHAKRMEDPAYAEEQRMKKHKREQERYQRRKAERDDLIQRAATDPQAAEELATLRAKQAEKARNWREQQEQKAKADPEVAARNEARRKKANENANAAYHKLIEQAKTDPEAAEKLERKKARQKESRERYQQRQMARAENDPAYAEELNAKRKEQTQKATAKRSAERKALIAKAETDPQAAEELAALRAKGVEASIRSKKKKRAAENAESFQIPCIDHTDSVPIAVGY